MKKEKLSDQRKITIHRINAKHGVYLGIEGFSDDAATALYLIAPWNDYVTTGEDVDKTIKEIEEVTRELYFCRISKDRIVWNSSREKLEAELKPITEYGAI